MNMNAKPNSNFFKIEVPNGIKEDSTRNTDLAVLEAYFEYIDSQKYSWEQIGQKLGFCVNKPSSNTNDMINSLSFSDMSKAALLAYLTDYKDKFHEEEDLFNKTFEDEKIYDTFVEAIKEDLKIYILGVAYEKLYSELNELIMIGTVNSVRQPLMDYLTYIDDAELISNNVLEQFIRKEEDSIAGYLPKATSYLFFDSLYKNILRFLNCGGKRNFTCKLSEYDKLDAIDIKKVPSEGTKNRKLLDKEINNLRNFTELIYESDSFQTGLHKALTLSRYNNKTKLFDILLLTYLSYIKNYNPGNKKEICEFSRFQHLTTKIFLLKTWEARKFKNPMTDIDFLQDYLFPYLFNYAIHIVQERYTSTKQIFIYKRIFIDLVSVPNPLYEENLREMKHILNNITSEYYKDYVGVAEQAQILLSSPINMHFENFKQKNPEPMFQIHHQYLHGYHRLAAFTKTGHDPI